MDTNMGSSLFHQDAASVTSSPLSPARSDITVPSHIEEISQLDNPQQQTQYLDREILPRSEHLFQVPTTVEDQTKPSEASAPADVVAIHPEAEVAEESTNETSDQVTVKPPSPLDPPDHLLQVSPLRSKRERKATTRYEDTMVQPKAQPVTPRPKRLHRAAKEPNYSPKFVMTSEKSILAKLDLDKLLSDDRAWTSLPRASQEALLAKLPRNTQIPPFGPDEAVPNLPRQLMKNSSAFRTDLRIFQEDLVNGRLDADWTKEAEAAMTERNEGLFDEWKWQEHEDFWGQKMNGNNG